jgi:hypothetical protein
VFEADSLKYNPEFSIYAVPEGYEKIAQVSIKSLIKHLYHGGPRRLMETGVFSAATRSISESGAVGQSLGLSSSDDRS